MFDILILVVGFERILLGETTERVDQMGAQVRVDVLWIEFSRPRPVHRPVGVVANHPLVVLRCRRSTVIPPGGTQCQRRQQ